MSARSPRSLSSAPDVALDFEESLRDLHQNDRWAISNLTLVAKESTEHAQAISKTLETHIKTTSPARKLPALYVLDSIVKNVGSPYTVYLGRNLFATFMDAYTLVEPATRRAMDAMLKTWKEPVPGSMDPRPVFPHETVRPIENALIRYKTTVLQNKPQVQPYPGHRNTPTPPRYNGQVFPPPAQSHTLPLYGYENQQPTPPTFAAATPIQYQQQAPPLTQQTYQQPQDVDLLRRDIDALIQGFQAQFALSPHDKDLQQKLQSLLALQTYVHTNGGRVDGQQIHQIRTTIAGLAASLQPSRPTPQPAPPAPSWQPPPTSYQLPAPPYQPVPAPALYLQTVPLQSQPPLGAPYLSPSAISSLQALLANGQDPSTPQMRTVAPALQSASHTQLSAVQNSVLGGPSDNANDLLAALAKNGLLSIPAPATTPQPAPLSGANAPAPPPAQPASIADMLKSLQSYVPPISQASTPPSYPHQYPSTKLRIPMTAAALRTFQPTLIHALYDGQPNQCSTCGRRFLATDTGRETKARHLDWHFRTNRRMVDPSINRGAHRNWFGDEIEWIREKEFDVSTAAARTSAATVGGSSGAAGTAVDGGRGAREKESPLQSYVRAPAGLTQTKCSICYEEIQSSYSEELQDWVFMNATTVGGRTVHATCAAEMKAAGTTAGSGLSGGQGGGTSLAAALQTLDGQRKGSATPDSALGKRKAGETLDAGGARMRME